MEFIVKTTHETIWETILNSQLATVLLTLLAASFGYFVKEFASGRKERKKDRERVLLEFMKLTELRLQKIIQKVLTDTWTDFHSRMFNITGNPHDREMVLDNLKISNKLGDEIMEINAELIKNRVEFQIKSKLKKDEITRLNLLIEQVINFAARHPYNFNSMDAQQLVQLSGSITPDAYRSINGTIRPRMIGLSNDLLNFLRERL
ncbi:hypothetical protein [Pseudochryseolinea flava]|uniref:Uncharacterized protein n=1 Tax=Pseudochryseolinea flava TaxID=2059302 RepID=A0A364XU21_9BACT|nr:hypothetical protein [Pseudochryseolinea flava]RAV97614.1 hypothetical protein DQQ10_27510 [Pseudochryseolinea flava]